MILRNYQVEIDKNIKDFIDNSSYVKGVCVAPVGTGKSLIPTMIVSYVKSKCLVLQPSKELLLQNLEKAEALGIEVSVFSASLKRKEIGNITYATHKSVINHPSLFKDFDYVVIDEAHLHMTNKMRGGKVVDEGRIVDFLNYIKPKKVIGLTATPIQLITHSEDNQLRMINRSKASYWCYSKIFSLTQIEDICNDWWSNIEYRSLKFDNSSLELNTTKTEYTSESLIAQYEANNFRDEIISQYYKLKDEGKKKILIFVPSIDAGLELNKVDRNLVAISSKTDDKERERLINEFKYGDLDCLVNTELLTTGFDCPELDGIILARATNSFVLYHQIIGRLVRLLRDGTKTNGVFLDLTGTFDKFGDIKNIRFEDNDYTKGWAMWNGDRLMTGVYLNSGEYVTRESQIKSFERQMSAPKKEKTKVGTTQFHFGKFKYKTVMTVCKTNMKYIQWLINNEEFKWNGERMMLLREDIINTIEQLRLEE